MKLFFLSALIFITTLVKAQVDTLKAYDRADSIIRLIDERKMEELILNSTDSIRCFLCKNKNMLASSFFKSELHHIFNPDLIRRLKSSVKKLHVDKHNTDVVIVFYNIYQKNELAPGHEGGTFGIWLYRDDDDLKFTGVETVP